MFLLIAIVTGPSPRVWGELSGVAAIIDVERTIPTRVGRTRLRSLGSSRWSDHPHACGENGLPETMILMWYGPSPRVWGELRMQKSTLDAVRTIPTRVGRTPCSGKLSAVSADHPHACGENSRCTASRNACNGPSPRVWGELVELVLLQPEQRTIPTRVGRTRESFPARQQQSDHPHACGENHVMRQQPAAPDGPSPRVWGEPSQPRRHHLSRRTIPTRVGRTPLCCTAATVSSDHPHACGENYPAM